MPFSFLTPLILLGLAGLAVPIIVHLIQRQRSTVVEFPSLMFLERVPYRSMRRQRIRHWFLFLLRALALILLVTAFSRPWLKGTDVAAGAGFGPEEVVILLDRSYSMGYGDRFDRARSAARSIVEALTPRDRATLVLFDAGAEARFRSTPERIGLLAALDDATPGSSATRYGPALKLTQSVLEQSELPRRRAVLIGDFQGAGWDPDEAVRLPPGTIVETVPILDDETRNVMLSSLGFQRVEFAGRERITVSARATNRSSAAVQDLAVKLALDGREISTEEVSIEPGATKTVTFTPFTLASVYTRGTVRSGDDLLDADNRLNFVLSPGEGVSVLIVEGRASRSESSLYLSSALNIGDRPRFQVDVVSVEAMGIADLQGRDVVILNDVRPPRGSVGTRLEEIIREGAGLLVVLGENSRWPSEGMDLLPGRFGNPRDRPNGRGGAMGYMDFSHPVFELFSTPRSGDFTSARFFRFRPLRMDGSEGVLARFDDGSVALAERRIERGRVLVWTTTLDSFWNDLALKPVFLPFMHQLGRYLANHEEGRPWHRVGQVIDLTEALTEMAGPDRTQPGHVAITPSGDAIELAVDSETTFLRLVEQGFYEVRPPESNDPNPLAVAVNLDLAESDLTSLDPEELAAAIRPTRVVGPGDPTLAGAELTPEDRERRQGLWKYLLLAAFALLALETAVSNRLSRRTTAYP